MLVFVYITLVLIAIHVFYFLYLISLPPIKVENTNTTIRIDNISLVLFSYNNKQYLKDKIGSLFIELSRFDHYELIVIDNNSTDGSKDELNRLKKIYNIKIVNNNVVGVASSINLGVTIAQYELIIFCDLRQKLSKNILENLIIPFKNPKIGAVSSCLAAIDSSGKKSLIRAFENFIKSLESKSGNLIGVYGPLYAIRKHCFKEIPNDIILEDLHLSLSILQSNYIVMSKSCTITDEPFAEVYNYKRVKRYFKGLIQLFFENNIFQNLNYRQKTMLLCHKYLRLIIPALSVISFFILCITFFQMYFIIISLFLLFIILIIIGLFKFQLWLNHIFLVYYYYIKVFFDPSILKSSIRKNR